MKTEKQQSAVEWLVQQLRNGKEFNDELIQQAKEMENQRIKNEREEAYNNGYANGQMDAFTN
jgi:CHASE3 domain sensor protein